MKSFFPPTSFRQVYGINYVHRGGAGRGGAHCVHYHIVRHTLNIRWGARGREDGETRRTILCRRMYDMNFGIVAVAVAVFVQSKPAQVCVRACGEAHAAIREHPTPAS